MPEKSFLDVVLVAFSCFFIVFLGIYLRKKGKIAPQADQTITWLLINVFTPCLIFDSILQNKALEKLSNLTLSPVVGFLSVALGIIVATLAVRFIPLQKNSDRKTFVLSNALYNYGYIPIPLALHMYDKETVGVLMVHNVGVDCALWTIGILLLGGNSLRSNYKRLFNAPLIALILALILNSLTLDPSYLHFFSKGTHLLGQAMIPIALLIVGGVIGDYISSFDLRSALKVITASVLLRLFLLPVCFIVIALFLPCSLELKRVIALQAAMPAALLPIVLAKQYDGSPDIAFQVIVSTSLVSLFTMPLWLYLGGFLISI
jgi:malate permease and related proteins